jgi:hypothetical protein
VYSKTIQGEPVATWCKHCEKNSYRSFPVAMKVALKRAKKDQIPLRVYPCPRRKGWHITHKPQWIELDRKDGR